MPMDPMADRFMYNPNDDTQNYPVYRLKLIIETLNESAYQNSPKVVKLMNKQMLS